jgi:hypothetical protein
MNGGSCEYVLVGVGVGDGAGDEAVDGIWIRILFLTDMMAGVGKLEDTYILDRNDAYRIATSAVERLL